MVARLVRDQKAAGSNPATSTTEKRTPFTGARFLCSRGGIRKAQALERPWGKPPRTVSDAEFLLDGHSLAGLIKCERECHWQGDSL